MARHVHEQLPLCCGPSFSALSRVTTPSRPAPISQPAAGPFFLPSWKSIQQSAFAWTASGSTGGWQKGVTGRYGPCVSKGLPGVQMVEAPPIDVRPLFPSTLLTLLRVHDSGRVTSVPSRPRAAQLLVQCTVSFPLPPPSRINVYVCRSIGVTTAG